MTNKYKYILRRRHFILASFQYRLLHITFIYLIAIVLVFAGSLFAPLILELDNDALSSEQQAEVANQFLALHGRVWPAVGLLLILLVMHSMLVSHRIAGPLYRFRRVFESVAGGDLSVRAGVRQKDYLEKESDSINRMLEALCTQAGGIKERSDKLMMLVTELKGASTNGSLPAIERGLKRMEAQVKELQLEANQFKTGPETRGDGGDDSHGLSVENREDSPVERSRDTR